MNTLERSIIISRIAQEPPEERRKVLRQLLEAFPAEWLEDVLVIAEDVRRGRKSPPPTPSNVFHPPEGILGRFRL